MCECRDGRRIVVGRHEDDGAEFLVVGLMEDDGLDHLLRLPVDPPCVVLCVDGEPGVVVEVVELSETAVAAELVAAGRGCGLVGGLSEVDVLASDDGDAPVVALNDVVGDDGSRLLVGVVEADAAAAVHGVGLVVVVADGVAVDAYVDGPHGADAVAVVADGAVGDGGLRVGEAGKVGDADAAHHIVGGEAGGVALDETIVDEESRCRDVDLRYVAIAGRVAEQGAMLYGERLTGIGRAADGRFLAFFEGAVADGARLSAGDEIECGGRRAVVIAERGVGHMSSPTADGLESQVLEDDVADLGSMLVVDLDGVGCGRLVEPGESGGLAIDIKMSLSLNDEGDPVGKLDRGVLVELERVASGNRVVLLDDVASVYEAYARAFGLCQLSETIGLAVASRREAMSAERK